MVLTIVLGYAVLFQAFILQFDAGRFVSQHASSVICLTGVQATPDAPAEAPDHSAAHCLFCLCPTSHSHQVAGFLLPQWRPAAPAADAEAVEFFIVVQRFEPPNHRRPWQSRAPPLSV